jgi:putative ABC transport system permease protein
MSLIFRLAFRNLVHDHLSFIATVVVGIVFLIVLVTVQMGLYFGFGRMVTMMIDHTSATSGSCQSGQSALKTHHC